MYLLYLVYGIFLVPLSKSVLYLCTIYSNKPFMQLNHILRTRDLVTKNDAKVAKQQESKNDEILNSDNFLDRGFTRPKVFPRTLNSGFSMDLNEVE